MGRITPENIDKWLFDWKEGNLSSAQKEELNSFLANNPEYYADRKAWSSAFVNPMPKASYPNKASLTKKRKPIYPYVAAASLLLLVGTSVSIYIAKSNSDLEFNQLDGMLNQMALDNTLSSADIQTLNPHEFNYHTSLNKFASNDNYESNTRFVNSNEVLNNTTVGSLLNHQAASHTTTITEVASSSDVNVEFMSEDFFNETHEELNSIQNDIAAIYEESEFADAITESDANNMVSKENIYYKTSKFKNFINRFKNAMASGSGIVNLRQIDLAIAGYNHLDFNPAFVGNEFNTKVQTQGHARWINDENQLISMNLSAGSYVHEMKGALGIQANYSNFGVGMYQDANVSLYYSPKIQINKWMSIDPAVKFTIGHNWMSESKINPGSEIELNRGSLVRTFENSETPNGTRVWYKDIGLGINFNTKWFYAAVSMDNILRHKTGIYSNNPDQRAQYGFNAVIGTNYQSYDKKWLISPFITYSKNENNHEMWFGTGARYNWLTFGAGVSTKADLSANVGFRAGLFQMFYQYELTKSNLRGARLSAHQVTFRINTKPNRTASKVVIL